MKETLFAIAYIILGCTIGFITATQMSNQDHREFHQQFKQLLVDENHGYYDKKTGEFKLNKVMPIDLSQFPPMGA